MCAQIVSWLVPSPDLQVPGDFQASVLGPRLPGRGGSSLSPGAPFASEKEKERLGSDDRGRTPSLIPS